MPDEPPPRESIGDLGEMVDALVSRVEPIELRPTAVGRMVLAVPFAGAGLGLAEVAPVLGLAVGAIYGLTWGAVGRRRVWIDHAGVRWRGVLGSGELGWDDIDRYTYWSGSIGRWIGAVGPARIVDAPTASVIGTRHHLTLFGADRKLVIGSELDGANRAVGRILTELHPRMRARGPLVVSPFELHTGGLHHRVQGLLPWVEVEKVVLTGELPPQVRVMKRGKALAWVKVRLGDIHNGMLLLEELAERGIPIDPGPRALVTAPLLTAINRSRALPAAKVVRKRPGGPA